MPRHATPSHCFDPDLKVKVTSNIITAVGTFIDVGILPQEEKEGKKRKKKKKKEAGPRDWITPYSAIVCTRRRVPSIAIG